MSPRVKPKRALTREYARHLAQEDLREAAYELHEHREELLAAEVAAHRSTHRQ